MQQEITQQPNTSINWTTLIVLGIFHVLAVVALFHFSWTNLWVTMALWWVSGSLGVGIGYHRLLTHRGFKTSKPVEYILTFLGTLSLESGPIQWVSTHRMHHAFTEVEGKDPHTPRDGIFWSHLGWMLQGVSQSHDQATLQRYVPDMLKDKFQVFMSKWYFMSNVLLGVILFQFGGWSMVLWGVFLRVAANLQFTWLVNSATHLWGTRRFTTRDDSTNNGLVALLTFGEGWHNNHHAHPRAARHGVAWYEFDLNWYSIAVMRRLGLVRDVKFITPAQIAAAKQQSAAPTVLREAA